MLLRRTGWLKGSRQVSLKYEGFYTASASVAAILYVASAFVRDVPTELLRRLGPVTRRGLLINAFLLGVLLVVIEGLSLLVLSGAMNDSTTWRLVCGLATVAFVLAVAGESVIRVLVRLRHSREPKPSNHPERGGSH